MNDQQLSLLTGIPVEQIATYNDVQRLQLIKMAYSKLPKMPEVTMTNVPMFLKTYTFNKNSGKARNDYSGIKSFKEAFAKARANKEKNFFWKKTKASPNGMFSTELKLEKDIPNTQVVVPKLSNLEPINKLDNSLPMFVKPYTFNKKLAIQKDWKEKGLSSPDIQNPRGSMPFMKKVFLQGGTVQQDNIKQQITQLVQAAANEDQQAILQIKQIMQAAQRGDLQALQIAQIIQEVVETMKQQSGLKAKFGAKLDYLNKLKGICPEGSEKVYLKSGGCMCRQKASLGDKVEIELSKKLKNHNKIEQNDTIHHNKQVYDLTGKHKLFKQLTNKEYRNLPISKQSDVDNKDMMRAKDSEKKACGGKARKHLGGGGLVAPEKPNFTAMTKKPNMNPQSVAEDLKLKRDLPYRQAGYNPDELDRNMSLRLEDAARSGEGMDKWMERWSKKNKSPFDQILYKRFKEMGGPRIRGGASTVGNNSNEIVVTPKPGKMFIGY